jgi:Zn-dependent protease
MGPTKRTVGCGSIHMSPLAILSTTNPMKLLRSFRIRCNPGFPIIVGLTAGLAGARFGISRALIMTVVIFFSFFMRELLRCGVALWWGSVMVRFSTFGSIAELDSYASRARSVAVDLFGPVTNLMIAGVGVSVRVAHPNGWFATGLASAVAFNLAWAAVSLLPIMPFDGGHLLRRLLGPRGSTTAMLVSVMVGELAGAGAFVALRSPELGLLLVGAGVWSFQCWLQSRRASAESEAIRVLHHAQEHYEESRYEEALLAAEEAATGLRKAASRAAAVALAARAALQTGQPRRAHAAIHKITPRTAAEFLLLAEVEAANGRHQNATDTLDRCRRLGQLDRAAARLLIDLHASLGNYAAVTDVAAGAAETLGPSDVQQVARALQDAGEPGLAGQLLSCAPPHGYGSLPTDTHGEPRPPSSRRHARSLR